jgi:very-short-patch-repair endonuclease
VKQETVQLEQIVDGLLLVDVLAETVDGKKLAIEADGSTHFRYPDGQLTGATLQRDRALRARGYVVVSVPYGIWNTCEVSKRQAVLQQRVQQAIQRSKE